MGSNQRAKAQENPTDVANDKRVVENSKDKDIEKQKDTEKVERDHASESDGSEQDDELTRANALKEFEGWSMEDHQNEMCALQSEFSRLAKRHFEETCGRIDEQVRSVNTGSDPEFKRNLQAVDRKHRLTCAALDAQKKLEFGIINNAYEEELYAVGETFEEDKEWYKQMLINQIRNRGAHTFDDGVNEMEIEEEWADVITTSTSHQLPLPTTTTTAKEPTKKNSHKKQPRTHDSKSSTSSPTRHLKDKRTPTSTTATTSTTTTTSATHKAVPSPAAKTKFLTKVKQLAKTAPIIYMLQPHEIQHDIMKAFKGKKR